GWRQTVSPPQNGLVAFRSPELPSVSLLQKTPSSPVSCHATGFFPHRAVMFWRKDGEELHEDVDQGEILPNPDGSFQMRVDLNISSVTPEDWRRYDCVFQLSGVREDVVTRLDKAEIRTNWGNIGIRKDEGGQQILNSTISGKAGIRHNRGGKHTCSLFHLIFCCAAVIMVFVKQCVFTDLCFINIFLLY
uniref:Ig-like domain-containing protein n=1 Tax=Seriola dumerili TaxID=41447 RepID=A0A3B4U307_SERDU